MKRREKEQEENKEKQTGCENNVHSLPVIDYCVCVPVNQLEVLELIFRLAAEHCSAPTNPRPSGCKDRVCYGRCIMLAATYDGEVGVALSGISCY